MKLNELLPQGLGLCVGLDPDIAKFPKFLQNSKNNIFEFNKAIIDATKDFAVAYKPNFAFYEMAGISGWEQLARTIEYARTNHLVIADAKRGDIGNTAAAYSKALFEVMGADMATVNPYLGADSITPFTDYADKGIFLLAVTSNPSSSFLQEERIGERYLFERVIELAHSCNNNKNIGLVVGATKPHLWGKVIERALNLPLLIPGVGVQGGDLTQLKQSLKDYPAPVLINVARSIIYASSESDFQEVASKEAEKFFLSLKDD